MAEPARPIRSDDPEERPQPITPPGRSLFQAVVTALVLVSLIGLAYFLGRTAFFVLAFIVVMMALFEFLDAVVRAGHRPTLPFTMLCGAALLVVAYLEKPAYFSVVLMVATFGGFTLTLLPGPTRARPSGVGWTLLGVAWVAGGGAGAVSILMLEPGGLMLLIASVLTAAADDIVAYFVGTRYGRHKMAPSISPGKSWEGFAAGFVAALAAGAMFGGLLDEINVWHGLAIGVICGFLAPVGDLVESRFKREVGIKDSGRLLPGHGGMLDRLDAIIFCSPVVYTFLRFVVF